MPHFNKNNFEPLLPYLFLILVLFNLFLKTIDQNDKL